MREREMKGKDLSRGTKYLAHSGEYGIILFLCKESLCTCCCHQRWVNLPVQLSVHQSTLEERLWDIGA